jgi:hypothetical protein
VTSDDHITEPVTPTTLRPRGEPAPQRPTYPQEQREDVLNDVVFRLGILHKAMYRVDAAGADGVELALEFVRAMKDAEA